MFTNIHIVNTIYRCYSILGKLFSYILQHPLKI